MWPTLRTSVLFVVGAVGFLGAAATFLPRATISPANSKVDPIGSPDLFQVQNSGLIPLKNIGVAIGICQITYNSLPQPEDISGLECNHTTKIVSYISFLPWKKPILDPDHRYTIAIQDAFRPNPRAPIGYADISLKMSYTLPLLPWWKRSAEFRFTTHQEEDGALYWREQ
jgi:hypothetical protein